MAAADTMATMAKAPYTQLHPLPAGVVAVYGRDFDVIDAATGAVSASTRPAEPPATRHAIPARPDQRVLASAVSPDGSRFAVSSDDKMLRVWSTATWELVAVFQAPKRPSSLTFTRTGTHLVVADKFGEVHRYDLSSTAEPEPLLGHMSLVTDVILGADDRCVITSDRDEKIRVSAFPDAYNIHSYCLGHLQFVTRLHTPRTVSELLVSGGGDGLVILWDYMRGQALHTVDLVQLRGTALAPGETVDVLAITSAWREPLVVVATERSNLLFVFQVASAPAPQLTLLAIHRVVLPLGEGASPTHVTAVTFDREDRLWVATDSTDAAGLPAGGLLQCLRWTNAAPAAAADNAAPVVAVQPNPSAQGGDAQAKASVPQAERIGVFQSYAFLPDQELTPKLAAGVWQTGAGPIDPAMPPILFPYNTLRKQHARQPQRPRNGDEDDGEGEDDEGGESGDGATGRADRRKRAEEGQTGESKRSRGATPMATS